VRWQHDGAAQPKTLAGSFLAAEVRAAGPTVIAELQRVIDSMPEVTRAGVYGQRSLHVGGLEASGPPGGQLQAVAETELIVLVAYGAGSDERRDNDRLQAACAVSLPLGSSTALEPTRVDDPRFDDTEHLVVLR